jgi:hypothetical protein
MFRRVDSDFSGGGGGHAVSEYHSLVRTDLTGRCML